MVKLKAKECRLHPSPTFVSKPNAGKNDDTLKRVLSRGDKVKEITTNKTYDDYMTMMIGWLRTIPPTTTHIYILYIINLYLSHYYPV
jgi:hypothetical protein